MIAEIQNSKAPKEFFRHGLELIGVMKEFFRMYSVVNGFPGQPGKNQENDHGYAMTQDNSENSYKNSNNHAEGEDDAQI